MEKLTNRILIIDDNPDNLELLADLIQHAFPGYSSLTASSGIKGLELAASADPDVILLDVVMPGMNGFEVCRKLKSDPQTSLIPVVFLTNLKGDREARIQAIEVGAEAFLSRPIDEAELTAQVRSMQKIKRSANQLLDEKENLTSLVAAQTQALQQTHTATLNLLEDLHAENEARKKNEEALRESEERFRILIEKAPVGIYISRNGVGVYANQKDLQMFGFSSVEEVIGRPTVDFLAPQSKEASLERTRRRGLGLPTPVEYETIGVRKDGAQFPVQIKVDLVQLPDGPANLAFITDISESKNAQALQDALYQIAAATESTATLDELYPQIHHSVATLMPAENFYIALYDPAQNLAQFPYCKDVVDESFEPDFPPGHGLTAYVLRTGAPLLCNQARRKELERLHEATEMGTPSAIWLGVPLIADGKTIGALVVQHYTDPHAYGEREKHILEFVSSQVAIAISRKQAEEALRKSETKFRAVVDNSHEGIVFTDASGVVLYRSPAYSKINGFSAEERLGKNIFEIIHPDDIQSARALWAEMLAHPETPFRAQFRIQHKDGTWLWIESAGLNLLGNPDVQAMIISSHDVSESKRVEAVQQAVYQIAAATETAASLDELYPQIHQSISAIMPAENFYIALYDEAQNLLRFPYFKDPKDVAFVGGVQPGRGTTAYVLRTGRSLLCTRERHAELERQGEVILLGVPSAIWLGVPLIVEGKTIGAMVVQHYSDPKAYGEREQQILEFVSSQVAIAISRKQAEEALRASETRYRGLFEHSPVSLWEEDFSEVKRHIEELKRSGVTDFRVFFDRHPEVVLELVGEIKVLDVNAATLELMHASRKEQLIGTLKQVIQVKPNMDFEDEFVNVAQGLTDFAWEGDNFRLDGERFTVSMHWSVAPGYEDSLNKVLVSISDITEHKKAEEAIRQLNASLEQRVNERTRELEQAQEQLVRHEKLATLGQLAGGVGHELRNPLGVINSAVYYLKLVQPEADEKIKKYHLMIEQEVHTASRIINDLLDFGRVITPDRQPVSIADLLQHVLTRYPAPPAVRVKLKIPASLPQVFADPLHLEQIIGNLTTNACQAMKDCQDGGTLTISATHKKDQVSIAVQDTGTGITPAAMQRLFEPLFTTKLRGIGLGLAVSKKLAEANGGRIQVRSEPGQGSTFSLYLPVKGS